MIPTAEDLIHYVRRHRGLKTRELAARFGVGPDEFEAFAERLLDLQVEGELLRLPAGEGWAVPEETDYRVGTIRLTRRGDAFVVPAKPDRLGDIHLRPDDVRDALDGDSVLVRIAGPARGKRRPSDRRRRPQGRHRSQEGPRLREGRLVEVVRRKKALIPGRFWVAGPGADGRQWREGPAGERAGFVRPLRPGGASDIYVAPQDSRGARDGEKVLVRLLDRPPQGVHSRGEVAVRLSREGTPEADFEAIAAEFGFPVDHPTDALEEASRLPAIEGGVLPASALEGREDLRGLRTFTIDPEDARDFDDAVSLERIEGGWRLGVHIADVSRYVPSGSALDRSAAARGTSIYLPGRVVPMLPERLSNDLSSLRPGEDRLTKTVLLEIGADGEVRRSRIFPSAIRSRRRFTYEEVLAVLDEADRRRGTPPGPRAVYPRDRKERTDGPVPPPLPDDAEESIEVLAEMADLRDALWRRRRARGALDLDIPRLRLRIDGNDRAGEVAGLGRDERDPSHHLIEELMLAANEAVASFCGQSGIPLVSRVHPPPDEDRIEDFFYFLEHCGLKLGRKGASKDLQRIVEATAREPLAPVIHLTLLRSLAHAEYSAVPALHFALATATYCHFTSPIRRYPDLLIHQALDEHRDGRLRRGGRREEWDAALPDLAATSSHAERRAEEAEREMTKLRLIRWLEPRVGEEMDAMVVAVHPFGFFVRTDEAIEGLVHVATLSDDFYEFDEESFRLRGRKKRRTFRLGDRVRVVLAEVNPDFREITFTLQDEGSPRRHGAKGYSRHSDVP